MAKDKKKDVQRQDWQPGRTIAVLLKIWRVVFVTAKILLGAVATVALVFFVCAFVLMGVLGDYLEEEILPLLER